MMQGMVGADPEFAIWDSTEKKFLPAHVGGIEARREAPLTVEEMMVGRAHPDKIFRDGFGVEINPHPDQCVGLFLNGLREKIGSAQKWVRKNLGGGDRFKLLAPSSIEVNLEEVLRDAPQDVLAVGCNPSFSAYAEWKRPITAPWSPTSSTTRMFSGHIHYSGFDQIHDPRLTNMRIRALDLVIGVPLTYIFQDEPEIFNRRTFYGKAGEFRLQTYSKHSLGLEYRTPGVEMWRHPAIAALMLALGREAMANPMAVLKRASDELGLVGDDLDGALQSAINKGEGLEKLLFATYVHDWKGVKNLDHDTKLLIYYSEGVMEKKALDVLRGLREAEFGPWTEPLSQWIEVPIRRWDYSITGVVDRTQEAHAAWPQYPALAWKEHFEGIQF